MKPFTYAARRDAAEAVRLAGGRLRREVSRRRHQPRRPDARDHRAAAALVDVTGLSQQIDDAGGWRPPDRRGGEEHRGRRAIAQVRERFPMLVARDPGRRVRRRSATWRRSAATSCSARAASTSTTTRRAATSARPGAGCDAIDGFNRIHAILGASPACVATHPSDMCVALAALDAIVHLRRAERRAHAEARPSLHRLPGDTPHIETELEPGELITAVEIAGAAVRRALHLPQGARSRELCLRAGLRRRRARCRTDGTVKRRAARARRRRAQALARVAGGGSAARASRQPRPAFAPPRRPSSRTRTACATTPSRSSSPGAPSSACCAN